MSELTFFEQRCLEARLAMERCKITSIVDASEAAAFLDSVCAMEKAAKDAKKLAIEKLCEWSKENNVKRADIGGGKAIVFSFSPKYKINNEEICKRYAIPDSFKELLASNAFKIGAIKASLELSQIDSRIDVSDCFEEDIPDGKVEIKPSIVDKRFLK